MQKKKLFKKKISNWKKPKTPKDKKDLTLIANSF